MQLYMFISIAVVLLSTVVLFFIFQRNNLKDLRYRTGLVFSAIFASAGSLLFPGLVTVFSANAALRFFIVFFLSILIYILVLFIVLILVFQIISKEMADSLVQRWEEKKLKRKNARELRLKEKEAQASKLDAGLMSAQEQAACTDLNSLPDEETAFSATLQQGSAEQAIADTYGNASVGIDSLSGGEDAGTPESQFTLERTSTIDSDHVSSVGTDTQSVSEDAGTPEDQFASEQPSAIDTDHVSSVGIDSQSDSEDAGTPEDQFALEPLPENSPADQPLEMIHPEPVGNEEERIDPIDSLAFSSADLQDNIESSEKIVDTSDIIDKMGIDVVTDSAHPVPDQQENSLTEIIKKAFLLKQQGDFMEAAGLYMTALDQKPDDETAFWIVLDICAIYKNTGHADLAEDILLTYIDAFEHLMSEELKDQILQSLYEG